MLQSVNQVRARATTTLCSGTVSQLTATSIHPKYKAYRMQCTSRSRAHYQARQGPTVLGGNGSKQACASYRQQSYFQALQIFTFRYETLVMKLRRICTAAKYTAQSTVNQDNGKDSFYMTRDAQMHCYVSKRFVKRWHRQKIIHCWRPTLI